MSESTQDGPAETYDGDITSDLEDAFSGLDDDMQEVVEDGDEKSGTNADRSAGEGATEGSIGEPEGGEQEDATTGEGGGSSEDGEPKSKDENSNNDEGADESEAVAAPDHWSADHKEIFNSAPDNLKDWLLERHKSMEADYTRGKQEIADFKRSWEPVEEMYAPYVDQLRQAGVTPQQHIQNLANADRMLNQDPVAGLRQVAQMYNIDLSQLGATGSTEGQAEQTPEIQSLQQELAALRGQVDSRLLAEYDQKQNTILSDIGTFSEAKAENGDLAHPYFDQVVNDMVTLANGERSEGREPNLADLYEKAVWSNTSVREQMQAAKESAAQAKTTKEARAKAAKAKKASKSVTGSPAGQMPSDDVSLREQLERQYG